MYEEKEKSGINIKSVLFKLILVFIALFVVLWIISIVQKNKDTKPVVESNLAANLSTMQTAALEYFTIDKMPEKINGKERITLESMLDKKLLVEFKDENGDVCDAKESYAEATKLSSTDYSVKVKLVCGKNSDYNITNVKLENDTLVETDKPTEETTEEEQSTPDNNESNTENNNTSSNTSGSNNIIANNNTPSNNNTSNYSGSNRVSRPTSTTNQTPGIALNFSRINISQNEAKTVNATVSNSTSRVSWSSSNPNVATVNNGVITGINPGTATVTASINGASSSVNVIVNSNSIPVSNGATNTNSTPSTTTTHNNSYGVDNTLFYEEYNNLVKEYERLTKEYNVRLRYDTKVEGNMYKYYIYDANNDYSNKIIYAYYINIKDKTKHIIYDNRASLNLYR